MQPRGKRLIFNLLSLGCSITVSWTQFSDDISTLLRHRCAYLPFPCNPSKAYLYRVLWIGMRSHGILTVQFGLVQNPQREWAWLTLHSHGQRFFPRGSSCSECLYAINLMKNPQVLFSFIYDFTQWDEKKVEKMHMTFKYQQKHVAGSGSLAKLAMGL